MRIKFPPKKQRQFFKIALEKLRCPSLRLLNQFGIRVNYQTLKSYFNENRTIPKSLFDNLCYLAKLNSYDFAFEVLKDNWGKVLGGKSKK